MDASLDEIFPLKNKASTETKSTVVFKHIPALDGLRGIAVLIVMLYHFGISFPVFGTPTSNFYLGVDIFFVLSGFLITSVLLKEHSETGKISLKSFYLRRTLRLVPAYWFFLAVLYFIGNLALSESDANVLYNGVNFPAAFLYLTNWNLFISDTGALTHTWSLSIEEQFYILWSLVLFLVFREQRTRGQIFGVTAAAILVLCLTRAVRAALGTEPVVLNYSLETRMDSLLTGALVSMVYLWKLIPASRYESKVFDLLAVFSLLAVLAAMTSDALTVGNFYGWVSPTFNASIGIIILWLATRGRTLLHVMLENPVLVWIGALSYSLYLWHWLAYEFSKKLFPSFEIQIIGGVLLAFSISAFSYYAIEKPFLRLKNRFQN